MLISKSMYLNYKLCPRYFYFSLFHKDKIEISDMLILEGKNGNKVGELARTYFSDTVSSIVEVDNISDKCIEQAKKTKELLKENHNCIAEASFIVDDLYCAVDLLKKEDDGYSIYEVKHSTNSDKDKYYFDVCFQKYVLKKLVLIL